MASSVTIQGYGSWCTFNITSSLSANTVTFTVTAKAQSDGSADATYYGYIDNLTTAILSGTFDYGGGSQSKSASKTYTNTVYPGQSATRTVSVKYQSKISGSGDYGGDTGSVSLTYTRPQATVTFNANGGTTPSSASKSVTAGSTYGTLPTTSRTGYTFAGWYTAASGGSLVTASTTVPNTPPSTLYAHWTANTYTVTFDADGGTVSPASKSVTYGSTYGTLPTPTRTGYEFLGWFSGNIQITESTTVTITAAQTLTAHWKVKAVLRIKSGNTVTMATSIYSKSGSTVTQIIGVYSVENGTVKQGV